MNEMGEAEKAGQINEIRISGRLLADVTRRTTPKGTPMLKSRMSAKKPGSTTETVWFDITVWTRDLPEARIEEMAAFHAGDAVVIVGEFSTWEKASGQINLQITAYKITHGIE